MLARVAALHRPAAGWLALGIAVAALAALANVALLGLSGWFVAAMGVAGAAGGTLDYFTPAAAIRACAILRSGGRYAERLATHDATLRATARLRVWLFAALARQPDAALAALHRADTAQRLRGDLEALEGVYLRLLLPLAVAVPVQAGLLLWFGGRGGSLALAYAAPAVLLGAAAPGLLAALARAPGRRAVAARAALVRAATDAVQGMPDLLAAGAAGRQAALIEQAGAAQVGAQARLARLAAAGNALVMLGANLALLAVLPPALALLHAGRIGAPSVPMAMLAGFAGFESLAAVPAALLAAAGLAAAARRVFALADRPPAPPPGPDLVPSPCPVSVRGLRFAHPGGPELFGGLDLDLAPGERVALVGPVGCGKSTLVLLLAGLRTPDAGRITLGGRDDLARTACFGIAPQQGGLFSGTLASVLRLGRPDADEAALLAALEVVGLADWVRALPDGLRTWIGEAGLTVSGGQARRLAVARALLRPAPVLVLDEPGEGVDEAAEHAMLARLCAALDGRSLILITHRRAGLELMHRVVTL